MGSGGMAHRMQLKDRTAVVTGAAGGIGRAIAVSLARRGCHLALADINDTGLVETGALVTRPGLRLSQHYLDVADRAAVAAFPGAVQTAHQGVDLLINNAGVALGGTFEQLSEEDFEWLFDINFWGVVRLTRAFLPLLKASDDARIVNLSSIFGIIAPPGHSAYVASKFAVRGFSNALRLELEGTSIGVTVVHPGGVATSIARNARVAAAISAEEAARGREDFSRHLRLAPERAGEIIVRGVERRQLRVLVGSDAKLVAMIERLAPVSYGRFLRWLERKP
jgi:NAD(P)-dependent dehydrogenase (short-subunit alcohol dehydrogenase family)